MQRAFSDRTTDVTATHTKGLLREDRWCASLVHTIVLRFVLCALSRQRVEDAVDDNQTRHKGEVWNYERRFKSITNPRPNLQRRVASGLFQAWKRRPKSDTVRTEHTYLFLDFDCRYRQQSTP